MLFHLLRNHEVMIVGEEWQNMEEFEETVMKFNASCTYDCYLTLEFKHHSNTELKVCGNDADMPISRDQFKTIIRMFSAHFTHEEVYSELVGPHGNFWSTYTFAARAQKPSYRKARRGPIIVPPAAVKVTVTHPNGDTIQFDATVATTVQQVLSAACSNNQPIDDNLTLYQGTTPLDMPRWSLGCYSIRDSVELTLCPRKSE
jgi:hypothetical protein